MPWFQIYFEFWYSSSKLPIHQKIKSKKKNFQFEKKSVLWTFLSAVLGPGTRCSISTNMSTILWYKPICGSKAPFLPPWNRLLPPPPFWTRATAVAVPRKSLHRDIYRIAGDGPRWIIGILTRPVVAMGPKIVQVSMKDVINWSVDWLIDWWTVDTSIIRSIDRLIDWLSLDWLIDWLLLRRFLLWFFGLGPEATQATSMAAAMDLIWSRVQTIHSEQGQLIKDVHELRQGLQFKPSLTSVHTKMESLSRKLESVLWVAVFCVVVTTIYFLVFHSGRLI